MMPNISKVLSGILLKTFFLSSLLTVLAYQIIYSRQYQSFESKQGNFIETIGGVFWTLVLTICSLTIFLNLNEKVRNRPILCILSFFFLPTLVTFIIWTIGDRNSEWLTFFINTFIYFLTLSFFYIFFVRQKSSSSTSSK
jgi:cytochrome bd-type quinol oxidase subunit 2